MAFRILTTFCNRFVLRRSQRHSSRSLAAQQLEKSSSKLRWSQQAVGGSRWDNKYEWKWNGHGWNWKTIAICNFSFCFAQKKGTAMNRREVSIPMTITRLLISLRSNTVCLFTTGFELHFPLISSIWSSFLIFSGHSHKGHFSRAVLGVTKASLRNHISGEPLVAFSAWQSDEISPALIVWDTWKPLNAGQCAAGRLAWTWLNYLPRPFTFPEGVRNNKSFHDHRRSMFASSDGWKRKVHIIILKGRKCKVTPKPYDERRILRKMRHNGVNEMTV